MIETRRESRQQFVVGLHQLFEAVERRGDRRRIAIEGIGIFHQPSGRSEVIELIGFVRVGDGAAIKFETFPYTRYGTVAAQVERVTPDAVNDEKRGAIFLVTLALKKRQIDIDGKLVQLVPGMNLTAEIKTGKRRVIEYLIIPIQRARNESLKER